MAFDNNQLDFMQSISRNDVPVLIGALCMASMAAVRDMQSDFLHDPVYVRDEGVPTRAQMIERAIDQAYAIFPEMLLEGCTEIDEIKCAPGETALHAVIRGVMNQIMKQRPDLMKIEYQPR